MDFSEIFEDKTKYGTKLKTDEYEEQGKYLIVDQGQELIAGYTDKKEGFFSELPVIIFGDHTRILKYIDQPFYIGADGVKILRCKFQNANYKYLFYALKNVYIPNTGYNRHFKWLKQSSIKYPDSVTQNRIVKILDTVSSIIELQKKELDQLECLIKARFVEMFGDPINNSKSFPSKKVVDVVTMQRGYDLPTSKRISSGNIPVYGSNGILGYHDTSKCDVGVITGRSGTLGEVTFSDRPFWPLNTTLFSVDIHNNNIIYLKYLLEFYDLKRFGSGTGVPTLNRNEFHNEPIIDVPLTLQNEFADFVKLIDKSKFINRR